MNTVKFSVKMVLHHKVPKQYLRDYVKSALSRWGGQRPPNDPLFPTEIESVTVGPIEEKPHE